MESKFNLNPYKCAHCGAQLEWNDIIPCPFCGYWICKSCTPSNCPKSVEKPFASESILFIDKQTKEVITPEGIRYGLDTYDPGK